MPAKKNDERIDMPSNCSFIDVEEVLLLIVDTISTVKAAMPER
jgi:hypothetical protein